MSRLAVACWDDLHHSAELKHAQGRVLTRPTTKPFALRQREPLCRSQRGHSDCAGGVLLLLLLLLGGYCNTTISDDDGRDGLATYRPQLASFPSYLLLITSFCCQGGG